MINDAKLLMSRNEQLSRELYIETDRRKELHNTFEDMKGRIRVYVRLSPVCQNEVEKKYENYPMRARFEKICRDAQISITKAIEEIDGEGKFKDGCWFRSNGAVKAWADRYFVIQHRGETRGLGGIFFDDQNDRDPDKNFEFSKECLNSVVNAYGPTIEKHKNDEFTQQQKEWQLLGFFKK